MSEPKKADAPSASNVDMSQLAGMSDEPMAGGATGGYYDYVTINLARFYAGTRTFIDDVGVKLDDWIDKTKGKDGDPENTMTESNIRVLMHYRRKEPETFKKLVQVGKDLINAEEDAEKLKLLQAMFPGSGYAKSNI